MKTPKQALEIYSAAELRGIKPSAFGGIVQLTNSMHCIFEI
jgi:hypothetical protein